MTIMAKAKRNASNVKVRMHVQKDKQGKTNHKTIQDKSVKKKSRREK